MIHPTTQNLMDKIVSLSKRRGFVFPGSEIYGGLANSWDYGPLGVELKNNIKQEWWKLFVHQRDDMVGIDAALIMNPRVWEASGHVGHFHDFMSECKSCHKRIRVDQFLNQTKIIDWMMRIQQLAGKDNPAENLSGMAKIQQEMGETLNQEIKCPSCGKTDWTEARPFDLMLKTILGATGDESSTAYLRPETAQAMFVNFKHVLETSRKKLPFGIAQQGKAFRNEITPGNFIFRTREFEQMEIEYFVEEKDWKKYFEHWLEEMKKWLSRLGVAEEHLHFVDIPDGERAHYSKRTVDIEYDYPFGQKELYGLAYRGDYDFQNHIRASGQDLAYPNPENPKEKIIPHVIEPTWGVDRSVLVALLEAYREEGDRVFLKFPNWLAPFKVAVFPLLANKPQLLEKAREVYNALRKDFAVAWDERGNVGKRYYSQDEIGTPYCLTIDFDSLEDGAVTIRDRDTTKQERVKIAELKKVLTEKLTI